MFLFEYDHRFGDAYGDQFIFYDYRNPEDVPAFLANSFDFLLIDPPFLSEECAEKFIRTTKILAKPDAKLLIMTGKCMCESM